MRKNKKYIPNRNYNPIVLSNKIEKLQLELEHHQNLLLSVNKANDLHVEYLSNFVRHDMKNAVQALSGIVYNAVQEGRLDEMTKKEIGTVQSILSITLDSFAKLIPSTRNNQTTLSEILNAVEMLSRGELQKNGISYTFDYDRNSIVSIKYPFQSLVQVIHNLVINSISALSQNIEKNIYICGVISESECIIKVYDNGKPISPEIMSSIFTYGFSTTGGSGVGLFHAKNVMAEFNGDIIAQESDMEGYTKLFRISFFPGGKSL